MSGPLAQLRVMLFSVEDNASTPQGIGQFLQDTYAMRPALIGLLFGGAILIFSLASRPMISSKTHIFWGLVVGLAIVSGWVVAMKIKWL